MQYRKAKELTVRLYGFCENAFNLKTSMDTINQIQALDSKRCSQNLIEVRVRILGPVKELKCGRLRFKNLSKITLFNGLKLKLVSWDVP